MTETALPSGHRWRGPAAVLPALWRAPAPVHVAVAAGLLLAVAGLNGRPGIFPDSAFYYSQGRYLAAEAGLAAPSDAAAARTDPTAVGRSRSDAPAVAGARWPAYGVLLYGAHRLGSLWILAALQCLICAGAVWLTVQAALARRAPGVFHAGMAGLALGSGLPFFAAFLMPDVFAGLLVAGAGLLLVYPDRLGRAGRSAAGALVLASAVLHPTHLLLLAGLTGAAAIASVLGLRETRARGVAIVAGLTVVAGVFALSAKVELDHRLGAAQGRPPFLAARLIADGPGRRLLTDRCVSDTQPYALCRFRRQPLKQAEDILWSKRRGLAAYAGADRATQQRISREELGFAADALAHDPLGVGAAALKDWGEQLALYETAEPIRNPTDFLNHPYMGRTTVIGLLPDIGPCRTSRTACAPRTPIGPLAVLHFTVLLLGLAYAGWRLCKPDARARLRTEPDLRRHVVLLALFAAAAGINAAICGVLSGPFARYEARLIWLLPLASFLLAARLGWPPGSRPARRPERRT